MNFFSAEFFSSLFALVMIDLVLAGDNSIVIGLAARNLPKELQRRAIIWGSVGAIGVRALATLVVLWLLKIPGLLAAGGLVLVWIAYKLLADEKSEDVPESSTFWRAIANIIIADAVMGLDNVLAVAGAAHGSFIMVVLGMLISVPIIIGGSTVVLRLIERYPVIITIGAGIVGWTAASMIFDEHLLADYFHAYPVLKVVTMIAIGLILVYGKLKSRNLPSQVNQADQPEV
ncbi:MAG TPA: TerC family protein [Bacillota bacterium]|nr:TerC family protein [Bacillota bacterium]